MKKLFAMAFAAVVGCAGCQQELIDPNAVENDTLKVYATIEDTDDTKTFLNDKEVYWTSGDRIAVFMNKTLRKRFEVSSESVGTKEGTFLYDSDYIATGKSVAISNNVAYYPFCEVTCAVSGGTYTLSNVTLPSTQNYASASFGQGAFPMEAVTPDTDDLDFAFKNLCGVLALQFKGSGTVKSITVKGNSNEILSGKATVTASYGKTPEISLLSGGDKTVTLDCGESGVELQSNTATTFFIVLPPVSFGKGFTVTVTDASGAAKEYSTTKKNVIHRSGILRMPAKEFIGATGPQKGDYIDEYGVNHGEGIKIGKTVWAPVNCGYHATDFKYGKLYQWGRKYGQGYSGDLLDGDYNSLGSYSDKSVPEKITGPTPLLTGQSKNDENHFYCNSSSPWDWSVSQNDYLWNSGTEENPVKTEYDPCPEGWRVPTISELEMLIDYSSWTSNKNGQSGYLSTGTYINTSGVTQAFFPASGFRSNDDGVAYSRGFEGHYWASTSNSSRANDFYFNGYTVYVYGNNRAYGCSVRCVQDDSTLIPVERVTLNKTSLSLYAGDSETLTSSITPSNANHKSAHWWSDDPDIATVSQNGDVTAVSAGTTTIYAMAGMQVATCKVIVTAVVVKYGVDYIDEYGINHGQGIKIGETVWAPVNCGYHKDDFINGKTYQWGRKYGQHAKLELNGYSIVLGPVSIEVGNDPNNIKTFYQGTDHSYRDWLTPHDDKVWNAGSEETPVKTKYDPCPAGWRVPTESELSTLIKHRSNWTTDENRFAGYWFSGEEVYSSDVNQIYLPSPVCLNVFGSNYDAPGAYWTSSPHSVYENPEAASCLHISRSYPEMWYGGRAAGYAVRCVHDDSILLPTESIALNKTSLTLSVGLSETLLCIFTPYNVDHQANWRSDNPRMATVDSYGKVTAVSPGSATIYANFGKHEVTCNVTVVPSRKGDYIDEYGINHGQGIKIDDTVWAPVNCGFHKDDYKYGKLYQWGRKYGQGYSDDARVPTIEEGGVSAVTANQSSNSNVFYKANSNVEWADSPDVNAWNSGTEENPLKTQYDPCPTGWRVPTYAELQKLGKNHSTWTAHDGQSGYWLSGTASYKDSASKVFFSAAGWREGYGSANSRGYIGQYWSSQSSSTKGGGLDFSESRVTMFYYARANAHSIRCVQE